MNYLTEEELRYFAERCDENASGRIIVSSHLIKKYRKLTGNIADSNAIIRSRIIDSIYNLKLKIK